MRRQNKKSLKNLKQYCKNRVRFTFYVRFRPVAQKLFFPIISLVLLAGIVHYEMTRDKSWVFINPVAAEFKVESTIVPEAQPSKSEVLGDGFAAQKAPQTQMLEGSTSTDPSPVRASSVVEETIKEIATKEGMDWKILMGIFLKETQGDCFREGDKNFIKPSWGCYQINKHYHPEVTWEQATDIEWSSQWTAKRLKAKAEKYGWDNAIAMHNGNPNNPAVQAYLKDVKRIMETL